MEIELRQVYHILKRICDEIGYNGISINYSSKSNEELSFTLWGNNNKDNIEISKEYFDKPINEEEINYIIEWLKMKNFNDGEK